MNGGRHLNEETGSTRRYTLIIGIDPGLTGAIASSSGEVFDLPTKVLGKGNRKIKSQIDGQQFYSMLYHFVQQCDMDEEVVIYLEEQMYRPRFNPQTKVEIPQGGASIFSLGNTYGKLLCAIEVGNFKVVEVLPAKWKKALQVTSDKEECRLKALSLFPDADIRLKKHHNRAEALLLVHYGQTQES